MPQKYALNEEKHINKYIKSNKVLESDETRMTKGLNLDRRVREKVF